jgi:hypothetical protein
MAHVNHDRDMKVILEAVSCTGTKVDVDTPIYSTDRQLRVMLKRPWTYHQERDSIGMRRERWKLRLALSWISKPCVWRLLAV